jgi:hypothetical protein
MASEENARERKGDVVAGAGARALGGRISAKGEGQGKNRGRQARRRASAAAGLLCSAALLAVNGCAGLPWGAKAPTEPSWSALGGPSQEPGRLPTLTREPAGGAWALAGAESSASGESDSGAAPAAAFAPTRMNVAEIVVNEAGVATSPQATSADGQALWRKWPARDVQVALFGASPASCGDMAASQGAGAGAAGSGLPRRPAVAVLRLLMAEGGDLAPESSATSWRMDCQGSAPPPGLLAKEDGSPLWLRGARVEAKNAGAGAAASGGSADGGARVAASLDATQPAWIWAQWRERPAGGEAGPWRDGALWLTPQSAPLASLGGPNPKALEQWRWRADAAPAAAGASKKSAMADARRHAVAEKRQKGAPERKNPV